MATQLNPAQLRAMFDGNRLRSIWSDAVNNYNRLRVHADGELPIWLIKDARPGESDAAREYREKIYEAETQNPVERVFGVFEKIRRSPDWMIRFSSEVPAIIRKGETLQDYITENYPVYGSLEDWLFEDALRNIGLDANAVLAVIPKEFIVAGADYIKPVVHIFNSPDVVDFVAEDYAVLKSKELSSLLSQEQQMNRIRSGNTQEYNTRLKNLYQFNKYITESFMPGQVYYVITTNEYQKWEENSSNKYELTGLWVHGLNELPAWQMPGKFQNRVGKYVLKRSLLKPMVPHLNKAARESNDVDAGVIKHLHLQKWYFGDNKCKTCSGTGKVPSANGPVNCDSCNGEGIRTGTSPFEDIIIKPSKIGDQAIQTPPVGYVTLDPEIIKIANDRIKEHIYKALEAVNMSHLADAQLNQSGTAKAYDGDEVNTIIYSFAEMVTGIANMAVYFINKLRYAKLISNETELKKLLPVIPVPEKFDVINFSMLLTEYSTAKNSGLNSIILAELQKEISEKKFYANPIVKDFVQSVMETDPFPDKTNEDKTLLEGQGLITKRDAVLSCYIGDFVQQALEENKNFATLSRKEKKDILLKYADEKITELSNASEVKQDIFENDRPSENGNTGNNDNTQDEGSNEDDNVAA
jgi:hypothetical protein